MRFELVNFKKLKADIDNKLRKKCVSSKRLFVIKTYLLVTFKKLLTKVMPHKVCIATQKWKELQVATIFLIFFPFFQI